MGVALIYQTVLWHPDVITSESLAACFELPRPVEANTMQQHYQMLADNSKRFPGWTRSDDPNRRLETSMVRGWPTSKPTKVTTSKVTRYHLMRDLCDH